jgi:Flavin containing amine oxidoreductase
MRGWQLQGHFKRLVRYSTHRSLDLLPGWATRQTNATAGPALQAPQDPVFPAPTGKSVRVLEARDRVGGRALSTQIEGVDVDLGAQWLAEGQDRMYALADEHDVDYFQSYEEGKSICEMNGAVPRDPPHHPGNPANGPPKQGIECCLWGLLALPTQMCCPPRKRTSY